MVCESWFILALCAQAAAKSIDFIINTVSAQHSLDPFLSVLKTNGKMCLVGIPEKPLEVMPVLLTTGKLIYPSADLVQIIAPSISAIFTCIENFLRVTLNKYCHGCWNAVHVIACTFHWESTKSKRLETYIWLLTVVVLNSCLASCSHFPSTLSPDWFVSCM